MWHGFYMIVFLSVQITDELSTCNFGIWNRFWNRSFIFGHIYIIRGQPRFHLSALTANYENFIFSDVYLQSDDFHSAAFFVCVLWLTADYCWLRLPSHSWTANDGANEHLETIKRETYCRNSSKWIEYNSKWYFWLNFLNKNFILYCSRKTATTIRKKASCTIKQNKWILYQNESTKFKFDVLAIFMVAMIKAIISKFNFHKHFNNNKNTRP